MTRTQAKREGERRWGKRSYWRVGDAISSPERRADAQSIADGAKAERAGIEAEIRRIEEAAGIPAMRERIKELSRISREQALGEAGYYKFRVGFLDSIIGAFNVIGEGDTWEEAFADADRKRASA